MTDLDRWAAQSIARGSKSFALASRLFDAPTKRRVRLLYAWCRHCDDVVDGQEDGRGDVADASGALTRLGELRARTLAGLADPAAETGAYAAIGQVALESGLPREWPLRHLDGFAMDAHERRYRSVEDLLDYCEHVAGVVGRMMAVVMGVDADDDAVITRAADLGLAFQITNICRDVLEDAA
ncbi:MAG: squalene/phytoene synthase family protein, partial [Pacificimonas sp.]